MVENDLGITEANIEIWKQFMKSKLNIVSTEQVSFFILRLLPMDIFCNIIDYKQSI
jgi:hypothetical protein